MALLAPVASIAYLALAASERVPFLSEKSLVRAYLQREPGAVRPLFYLNYLPVSASFYSRGKAGILTGENSVPGQTGYWLAVHKSLGTVPSEQCRLQFHPRSGLFDLYLCRADTEQP